MRSIAELDVIPAGEWSEAEGFAHLCVTFDEAAKTFPSIMERYVILLAEADNQPEKTSTMRRALRETLNARHPYPETVIAEDRMRRAERMGREIDRVAEGAAE